MLSFFPLMGMAVFLGRCHGLENSESIVIPRPNAGAKYVPRDLQSFSIEFAFFPDYAGNKSHPNHFSKNLLENFKDLTGVYPLVRVGGTSQDHSDYFPEQEDNIQLIYEHPDDDQPIQINYGPTFFESYHTLGPVKFLHGLNQNQNRSIKQLQGAAIEACTAIGPQLHLFELGNEWNFAPGSYRSANYSLLDYVHEWNYKSSVVKSAVQKACPGPFPGFMAPSFVLLDSVETNGWTVQELYNLGYDDKNLTKEFSFHNYMGVNLDPTSNGADDLQKTLMNHTSIIENLAPQIGRSKDLAYLGHLYTLGEMNSIAGQGRNGETNVFGDALWMVDFSLWAAAHNIKRLHLHQGLNYRYTSWQPIPSKGEDIATRPPYYGQIMVAATLGRAENSRVVNIPLKEDTEAAYGIYHGEKLSKIVVMNMKAFNETTSGGRPCRQYQFKVPGRHDRVKVERMIAPGSDSTSDVTFGGISYDYDLRRGKPVTVHSEKEMVEVRGGTVSIDIPDSSAALLTLI
ncbi:hypothetical protein N7481_002385 [Penicillium waksmanii]|uniref:uncharacterized protein n=1 Tax=Penicillium waksmanii TaxID=69791 RepID=UPI002547EE35|nr:uncharacterized protein N7481_002385 [Penicillium waksmanii]KAJ5995408.1 hypothetical protein N7481_002385 [Penicillium waksmanii]